MARGKAAVQNANRRTVEVQERADQLQEELRQVKVAHALEVNSLRAEIRQLRNDMLVEAGRIAAEDVILADKRTAEAQRHLKIANDFNRALQCKTDKLMMNACRFISMIYGQTPSSALANVVTWATDENVYGFSSKDSVKLLAELGVPKDGWVARTLSRMAGYVVHEEWTRRRKLADEPFAFNLDDAEEEFKIHPGYKSHWYPRVKHGRIVLLDEEGRPTGEGDSAEPLVSA